MMVHFNDGNAFDTATGFRYEFLREIEGYSAPEMIVYFPSKAAEARFTGNNALYLRECIIEQARADEQYLMGNLKIGELQARLRPAKPREMPKCDVAVDDRTPF